MLREVGYPEHKLDNTVVMLRRIVGRAFLSAWEYHTLMGVLRRIERGVGVPDEKAGVLDKDIEN